MPRPEPCPSCGAPLDGGACASCRSVNIELPSGTFVRMLEWLESMRNPKPDPLAVPRSSMPTKERQARLEALRLERARRRAQA